jgi:hypothetical protein
MAQRAGHDRPAQQPVLLEAAEQLGDLVRRLGTDQAATDRQRREVSLVAGALDQLGGAADQPLGI